MGSSRSLVATQRKRGRRAGMEPGTMPEWSPVVSIMADPDREIVLVVDLLIALSKEFLKYVYLQEESSVSRNFRQCQNMARGQHSYDFHCPTPTHYLDRYSD